MPTLPTLPIELWQQIVGYVLTPTRPVAVESWSCSTPVLQFAPEDVDVQKSFTLFTGPTASAVRFLIPISTPFIYHTLISQSRWQLKRNDHAIEKLVMDHWPYARGASVPYAHDLSRLQTTFTAPVHHVDIVIDCVDSFNDDYFNWRVKYELGCDNQWATAQIDQITAVLETCAALKSLCVFLDVDVNATVPRTKDLDTFYRSHDFRELWKVTAPRYYSSYGNREWNPVGEWKEECRARGIEFGIVARLEREDGKGIVKEDLAEFWDLPEEVKRDRELWYDQGLAFAIEANAAKRGKETVEIESRGEEGNTVAM